LVGENGQKASISIFLAVGTRSVANIKARVIDNYTQAISGTSRTNCCSTDTSQEVEASATCGCSAAETDLTVTNALGYPVRDLQEVPGEATEVSFGCGNPLAIANLKPGEFVLDIGSGGGIDAFLAARKVGAAGKVIGVDMTPAMIERSTKSAEKGGFQQVEFRLGQAENLPVEDGLVDVILSNCVINLTEDKGRVFGEAYRVLKEGGRLEVSDMVTSGSFSAATRGNLDEWSGCVAGAIPAGEYLDLIAQAGFKDIQTRRSSVTEQSGGVEVYSLLVSAVKGDRKPSRFQLVSPVENQTDCGCGSGSGTACCG
jgi:2-polyprenyl-3-methyl-5-hydroxy-6-metoxy-1,4-benzoquinol methylase